MNEALYFYIANIVKNMQDQRQRPIITNKGLKQHNPVPYRLCRPG